MTVTAERAAQLTAACRDTDHVVVDGKIVRYHATLWCNTIGEFVVGKGPTVLAAVLDAHREAKTRKRGAKASPMRTKLERHCPRCRAHHYHFARAWQLERSNGDPLGPVHVDIDCAGCGHTWRGRFKREEWE
jgi:DNA-directed RNA polymerase subunit M/transcription elongation factor TFIIS